MKRKHGNKPAVIRPPKQTVVDRMDFLQERKLEVAKHKREVLALYREGKLTGPYIDDNLLLAKAIRYEEMSLVDLYYTCGANMNRLDEKGFAPIHIPFNEYISCGKQLIEFLIREANVDIDIPFPHDPGRFPEAGKKLLEIINDVEGIRGNFLIDWPAGDQREFHLVHHRASAVVHSFVKEYGERIDKELRRASAEIEVQRGWTSKDHITKRGAAWSYEI